MQYESHTKMGGSRETFLTTQWSLIEDIKEGRDQDRIFIGFLLEHYFKSVYCFMPHSAITPSCWMTTVFGRN